MLFREIFSIFASSLLTYLNLYEKIAQGLISWLLTSFAVCKDFS